MTTAWALIQPHGAVEGESAPRRKNMKYAQRLAVAALVVMLSGCIGRWFDSKPKHDDATPVANTADDFDAKAAAYIRDLCALPREERDMKARSLNEALLPNHANISCGRGGYPDE